MRKLETKLDENYYVATLDVETRKLVGKEEKFKTLEGVLGFLHKFEETENRESIFACLMGLRDGKSEVVIQRKQFQAGDQILRITPPKRFHKLFWEGFGLEFSPKPTDSSLEPKNQ